jgi:hypothetical protein
LYARKVECGTRSEIRCAEVVAGAKAHPHRLPRHVAGKVTRNEHADRGRVRGRVGPPARPRHIVVAAVAG